MFDNFQRIIESYSSIPTKPYLQPLAVPKAPRFWYWSGILMQGVIPYGMSQVAYWSAPREPWSVQKPLVAPVNINHSTAIFSGQAPTRGIYTGVK